MATANFSIDYLLNLLMMEGIIGKNQGLKIKEDYIEFKRNFNRKAVAIENSNLSTDPIDYLSSLKLPIPGTIENFNVDDEVLARLMAKASKIPFRRVEPRELDLEMVTKILPQTFAAKHMILPLGVANGKMEVGVRTPFSGSALEDVKLVSNLAVNPIILSQSNLKKLINEIYAFRSSIKGATNLYDGGNRLSLDLNNLEQYVKLKNPGEIKDDDQHIKNLIDYLFSEAFDNHASDIHIEPKRTNLLIRMRFDGVLHDMYHLPKVIHSAVVSRIKTISRLDITEKRRPQDGRIKILNKGEEAEIRVSTVPVAFGEKIVMRILQNDALFMNLSSMFSNPEDLRRWESFSSHPFGMILVTGPTGSGKTTTLYSTLRHLSTPEVNVVTVEDPIEMVHDEFNQIAVQPKIDITFSSIIRNILRQDPDVIMVGEMRDAETANNAVQAALTGHLVLSTLHTNDAPSAVTRMIDLGVAPFLVTSTVIGIMAQRLLRRICKFCIEDYMLTKEEAANFGLHLEDHINLKRGRGCERCRNTGYLGRLAAIEVMPFTDTLKQVILKGNISAIDLKKEARREGMTTLRENAIDLMMSGYTTIDEVLRVTTADN